MNEQGERSDDAPATPTYTDLLDADEARILTQTDELEARDRSEGYPARAVAAGSDREERDRTDTLIEPVAPPLDPGETDDLATLDGADVDALPIAKGTTVAIMDDEDDELDALDRLDNRDPQDMDGVLDLDEEGDDDEGCAGGPDVIADVTSRADC